MSDDPATILQLREAARQLVTSPLWRHILRPALARDLARLEFAILNDDDLTPGTREDRRQQRQGILNLLAAIKNDIGHAFSTPAPKTDGGNDLERQSIPVPEPVLDALEIVPTAPRPQESPPSAPVEDEYVNPFAPRHHTTHPTS